MIIGTCPVCGAEMRVGTDMTNADRIRSMTDDELCEFIGFATQDAFAYGAGLRDHMMIYPFGTHEDVMAWLRQEATK